MGSVEHQEDAETETLPSPIEIFVKETEGLVNAELLVSLKPSEALVQEIATRGMKNPHYVVSVSSVTTEERYGSGTTTDYFNQTSSYIQPFNRPYPVIRFSRPGQNYITATVVDIDSKDKAKWADKIRDNKLMLINSTGELRTDEYYVWGYGDHIGFGSKNVNVPSNAFSVPSQWKVDLVRQFWRRTASDDCDLRKKLWFYALEMTLLIQLYGFVVRPLLFLAACIMLKREIRLRQFFGTYWPHQGWKNSGESWWFTDAEGKNRRNIIPLLSPPVLGVFSAMFFGLPAIAATLWDGTYWGYVLLGFACAGILALVIAVIFAILWLVGRVVNKLLPRHEETAEERLVRLRTAAAAAVDSPEWDNIPESQKTLYLRFANVKSKVCRPIAK